MGPEVHATSGDSGDIKTGTIAGLVVDIDVTALRGDSPTLDLFVERKGSDSVWYPIYSPDQLTSAGVLSDSIGIGYHVDQVVSGHTRLRWALGGTAIATTVTTGATSATQTLGDTTGILAGDVLHFATANVNRTVQSVTNGTVLVLTQSVTTVDSEAVTDTSTPNATFSASILGVPEN